MLEFIPIRTLEKLTRFYSLRREREIAVRVQYSVEDRNGCKIYGLTQVEELD